MFLFMHEFACVCVCVCVCVYMCSCISLSFVYVISLSFYLLHLSFFKQFSSTISFVLGHWLAFSIWHHLSMIVSWQGIKAFLWISHSICLIELHVLNAKQGTNFSFLQFLLLWSRLGLLQNRLISLIIFKISISPTKLHPK